MHLMLINDKQASLRDIKNFLTRGYLAWDNPIKLDYSAVPLVAFYLIFNRSRPGTVYFKTINLEKHKLNHFEDNRNTTLDLGSVYMHGGLVLILNGYLHGRLAPHSN